MSPAAWEAVFMLIVLKIPIVYLCLVVWWAIRAEPRPLEGARIVPTEPEPELGPRSSYWRSRIWPRRLRPGPHGSPVRRPARAALRHARAKGER
jgi:hypothetical protein